MDDEAIAATAGFATVGYVAASHVVVSLLGSTQRSDGSAAIYATPGGTADTFVLLGVGVGLGYALGREIDFERTYRRFLRAVGAGTAVAIAAVVAAFTLAGESWGQFEVSLSMFAATLLASLVQVALVLTVCAVAGAALANVRAIEAG